MIRSSAFYRRAIQTLVAPRTSGLSTPKVGVEVSQLRVAILSDALRDRNGVDAYYRDLVSHLRGRVAVAELLNPGASDARRLELFAMPLPGDRTQKVCCPNPFQLYARLRKIDPHVMVVATPGPFGLAGAFAARLLGAGLITGFHTHLERLADLYWNRTIGRINSGYLATCNRILFRASHRVVVNSRGMVGEARRLGATKVELVGTPLPAGFMDTPVAALASFKHVLYAGRLSPEKNLHLVVEAARRLPHVRFSIAGKGPLAEKIAAHANALVNLRYLGWIPRERLMSVLDGADLLVLPSRIEAFGTVALEAMARGKLALVSPQCGIVQWPGFEECIFHVQPDEHLADAIDRIARLPPEVRARAAANGPLKARELHEETLRQWLGLLQRVSNSVWASAADSRSAM